MSTVFARGLACVAVAFTTLFSVGANAVTIDFDGANSTSSQTVGFSTYEEDGFVFGITTTGYNRGAAIFNTTCAGYLPNCNNDPDLVPAVQGENSVAGNVLILQERGQSRPVANDAAAGGSIMFTLLSGSAFRLLGFSAVDDGTFVASAFGATLGQIILTSDNQTGSTSFLSPIFRVGDSFTLIFSESGGIDALQLAPVPLPAASVLLLTALGGIGLVRRRASRA